MSQIWRLFPNEYVWTQSSERSLKSWLQPQSQLYIKIPKDSNTSFMYKWQIQKQQRSDAVAVSGDTGSLTAGTAPAPGDN